MNSSSLGRTEQCSSRSHVPLLSAGGRKVERFIFGERWIVNIHPASRETKVLRKKRVSRLRAHRQPPPEPPRKVQPRERGTKTRQQENPSIPRAGSPAQGQGGTWQGSIPGLQRVGSSPRLTATPELTQPVRWLVQHRARRALGHACHSCGFPQVWAPHPHSETLVISGSVAFYPASHGALIALFIPQPPCASSPPFPDKPRGLTASPCPEDSQLEWHLKGTESSQLSRTLGGRAGGRRWLRWQLDPKPRGEGFAPAPSHCANS